MARILVIANRTLHGSHLGAAIKRRVAAATAPTQVHIVVPHSEHTGGMGPTEGDDDAVNERIAVAAQQYLLAGAEQVSHELLGEDPVEAATQVLARGDHYDEILVSTFPLGPSRWLGREVPQRLARAVDCPVTHLVFDDGVTRPRLFG